MPVRKKKSTRLRSVKPKNRWWGFLVTGVVLLAGVWFFSKLLVSATLRWTAGVKETQAVALVNSSDRAGAIVIALLDPDEIYSKAVLILPSSGGEMPTEPWQIASVAGVLVNRVIQFSDADFSDSQSIGKTVRNDIFESLKAGNLQRVGQLLPIGKILSQKGIIKLTESRSAATELSVLSRLGDACPIGIANTTSVSGVASRYADFVSNQGGLVVRVTNEDFPVQDTVVTIDDQLTSECTAVANLLKNALPGIAKTEITSGIYAQHRVGILVLLGQNAVGH